MATWFTADLHLGHRNIIDYCDRPFADVDAMNRALIDNWNHAVAEDDTVWVVGDFALGKIAETLKRVSMRGVCGTSKYHPEWQTTIPYPTVEKRDPSLGIPHLYFQVQDFEGPRALILPVPYDTAQFVEPSWFS